MAILSFVEVRGLCAGEDIIPCVAEEMQCSLIHLVPRKVSSFSFFLDISVVSKATS